MRRAYHKLDVEGLCFQVRVMDVCRERMQSLYLVQRAFFLFSAWPKILAAKHMASDCVLFLRHRQSSAGRRPEACAEILSPTLPAHLALKSNAVACLLTVLQCNISHLLCLPAANPRPRRTCCTTLEPADSDTPRHILEIACSGGIIRKGLETHRTLGTG
jgi:hypothetical protein